MSETSSTSRRWTMACAGAALVLAATACSDSSEADDGPTDETTTLVVGITPIIDHASVFIAIEEGFFDEEGLSVSAQPVQGGAAAVPAMVSDDLQAAFASYPSFFLAESQYIGVTIVAEGVRGTEETAGIYVNDDSPIEGPEDLEGRTIAVNTLNNIGDVSIAASLEEQGVETAGIEFVEYPFPDMVPALEQEAVDAVWLVEPFRSGAEKDGARKVFSSYTGIAEGIPVSGIGMADEFVAANPTTVEGFTRAIERANGVLAEDPAIAAEIVQTYSETTEEQADAMELPVWTEGAVDVDELGRWNDLLLATGVLHEPIEMSELTLQD
ncbi:ABC transporter substrate-binding protein [Nocardiopsis sp. SBT366]|uniref:ABC transporter substrate-binding protein n=1 Tax=Nocardiopsis sp. SBT366 TaxID=1580529 RepID=UPI0018F88F9D|nr:ABC transporter substrate-binding protein [Nocardiopsis sp. SBT366]